MPGEDYTVLKLVNQRKIVAKYVRITLVLILLFVAILFLPWQQTVHGVGKLIALDPVQRDYDVVASYDGIIEQFFVEENQFVKKGTPLFSLQDLDKEYLKRLRSIQLAAEEKYQAQLQKRTYIESNIETEKEILRNGSEVFDKKIRQFRKNYAALARKKEALSDRLRMEKRNYRRILRLYKEGIESQREMELKKNSYISVEAEYEKVATDFQNAKTQIDITIQEKSQFEDRMKTKINNLKNSLLELSSKLNSYKQQLERASAELSRYQSNAVVAKSDGYIQRIYQNDKNRFVKKGEKILLFSPLVTKRVLRLRVSDFNMPLIKKGLKARIMFYGWPSMQISGWPLVSKGTYGGVVHRVEATAHEDGRYYVLIAEDPDEDPWPERNHLRIGTQANVWIRLGIVPIWYEIWRLLAAQPPKLVSETALWGDDE